MGILYETHNAQDEMNKDIEVISVTQAVQSDGGKLASAQFKNGSLERKTRTNVTRFKTNDKNWTPTLMR